MRAILDSAPQGFSVWGLDLRLVVCNRAYLDIYSFPADEVVAGVHLTTIARLSVGMGNHPDSSAEEMYGRYMQRLEEARSSGKPVRVEKAIRGKVIASTHTYLPYIGWLVMHEDITEQTEQRWMSELAEKSLDTQNRRFSAALESMSHGLSMYDADWRLVTCNARYLDLYGLSADTVKPGTPFASIIEQRRLSGAVPDNADDFGEHVLRTSDPTARQVQVYRFINGRVVQVAQSPIAGGGFVAIHQDITEDVARLDALKASHEEIALQKLRFETALANMSHGLSIFDGQMRIVTCNTRYRDIYALPDSVGPGSGMLEIAEMRTHLGTAPAGQPDFLDIVSKARGPRERYVETTKLENGRSIQVTRSPVDGGGFVAVHQDITEDIERLEALERAERSAARQNQILTIQNERFDAAISNMSQGLCLFDGDERLVVCNERYAALYNLPPELIQPGTTLAQIVEHRFTHGMVPKAGKSEYLKARRRLAVDAIEARDEIEFEDGRTIFIHHRPMKGGGWVATHEDVTEQRRIEARVRHLARHDALTDLPNRAYLREHMDKVGAHIRRGNVVAVLALDLDHFKAVNDTLGHAIGDHVLIEVASRLKRCARENDLVARLGGDEFAMILQSLDDPQDAATIASRIVKLLAEPMEIEGHQIHIGTSVGIALAPSDGTEVETLLKNADTALYRAKSEGRGNYHFFERGMDDALQHRRMLEQGLRVALARNEFRLMYQPLLDLTSNRICCFEALLRWDHPEQGTISPVEFIPVAEETGLISPIGEWVLREACKAAAEWPSDVRIAVNLSPAQFKQRGLVEHVISALADADMQPERLELEVTESLLLADTEATLETLHRLRALGVRISMDDFGTGYSSLSYLRSFPFDKIKIDRTFVAGLKPGDESTAIIRAVVGLGHSLGMSTTAEGIETEAQLQAVREQGCNEVQGFLFSPPLPASGIAALLGMRPAEILSRKKA